MNASATDQLPKLFTMEEVAEMLEEPNVRKVRKIVRRDNIEVVRLTSVVWRMTSEQVEKFLAHLSKQPGRADDGLDADRLRVARQRARQSTTKKTRGRTAA